MTPKYGYRLAGVLMSVTLLCLTLTASRHVLHDSMLMGPDCCYVLSQLLPLVAVAWVVMLVRTTIIATILISVGFVCQQLWRTYRVLAQLQATVQIAQTTTPNRLVAQCTAAGLRYRVVALATPTPLAFCAGLVTPHIYLSTGLIEILSDKELRAVLLHEAFHCARYDPLRTLLAESIATALFFLPIVAEWRDLFVTSLELAADRHAMHVSGRWCLAGALHKLLTYPQVPTFSTTRVAGIAGISATEARLAQVLDNAPLPVQFSPYSLLLSSLILVVGCFALQIAYF